jgi:hypothetical protein
MMEDEEYVSYMYPSGEFPFLEWGLFRLPPRARLIGGECQLCSSIALSDHVSIPH